jgi:HK97 gp10 family phage protein
MSVAISINLSNFDVIGNCLKCLCEQYPEAVSQTMMSVAQNILATANTLVPVRTGFLKSTLALEQPSSFQINVKATAPYAYYVEFGTRKMSARLFLTNSVNQHLPEFGPAITEQIQEILQG